MVAAAFTHRDSHAGDPDLHTHIAVANKVQTLDGRWLSIDGRVLFKAKVAASETYNTSLEQHLRDTLGVRFAERPGSEPGKRPIREIERDKALLGRCDGLSEFLGVVAHRARFMHYPEMSVQLESFRQARRRFPSSDESQISISNQAVSRLGALNRTKPFPAES
jgi:hypothetical protein